MHNCLKLCLSTLRFGMLSWAIEVQKIRISKNKEQMKSTLTFDELITIAQLKSYMYLKAIRMNILKRTGKNCQVCT